MKRIIALLLGLLLLSGCGLTQTSGDAEPFSADFTIRENPEPTEVFIDSAYSGETKVYRTDSIPLSDLRTMLSQTVFGGRQTVSLWRKEIVYAFDGAFHAENAEAVNEIAGELEQCAAFPGLREALPDSADVLIRFADEPTDFSYTTDAAGYLTGGTITVPVNLSLPEQKAVLYASLFHLCGFLDKADTAIDSVLSANPTNTPQEADWILLDFLYTCAETGMTESACLKALETYIMQS